MSEFTLLMKHLLGVLLLWLSLSGCDRPEPPPQIRFKSPVSGNATAERIHTEPVRTPPGGYVGSQSCIECHSAICDSYAQTAMGRSASSAAAAPVIENYAQDWVIASHGFRYRAELKEGQIIHHEQLVDSSGQALVTHSETIDWELGSGTRGRSYLIQRGEQMLMSPLTWYTMGGKFDISPGYAGSNRHFERPIGEACSNCHVGQIALANTHQSDRFSRPAFTVPQIDCERCHGPAANHIQHHRDLLAGTLKPKQSDPIVNPVALTPDRRDSVCYQCHLLGVEKVLRFGHSETDFRPGQTLSDIWVIFHKGYDGVAANKTTDAVNQVAQMESSQCFQQSGGQFSCVSCHDPHQTPPAANRDSYFREKCTTCHQSPQQECSLPRPQRLVLSPGDSCIQCHMPSLPSRDVQHTSQTDHRILRDARQVVPTSQESASYRLYHGMESLPDWEKIRARGLLMIRTAVDEEDRILAQLAIDTLQPIDQAGLDDAEVKNALGDAFMMQRHVDVAVDYWKAALAINPQFIPALKNLAIANHDIGQDLIAEQQMRQYLAENTEDRVMLGRHVHVLGKLQRFDEAKTLAEIAIQKFPMDLQLRTWLANYYQSTGNAAEADKHRKVAHRLQAKTGTGSGLP